MPVCRQRKFIFVHIPKTGGSSIEKALGLFGRDNNGANELCADILYGTAGDRALQHLPAREISRLLSRRAFNGYFKFAFVRNPYERTVSAYHFHLKYGGESLSFEEYLEKRVAYRKLMLAVPRPLRRRFRPDLIDDHVRSQHRFILSAGGRMLVDFVGRYENLESDFRKLARHLGCHVELPRINATDHRDYREYYDHRLRRLLGFLYRRDLALFGYRF